jgi:hypothetical protein
MASLALAIEKEPRQAKQEISDSLTSSGQSSPLTTIEWLQQ